MKRTVLALFILMVGVPDRGLTADRDVSFYLSAPDTALYVLDTLSVTAGRYEQSAQRLPFALSVTNQTELQHANKGLSLEEVLRTIPGVQVNNRYNLSQGDRISIRGLGSRASFGVRGLKIMLDGVPLTMPDGQSQLNNIDLASLGRIEILRGPSSSLYGNASGGVIVFESLAAPDVWRLSQRFTMGADSYQKSTSSIAGLLGKTNFAVHYTALRYAGFREHSQAKNHVANVLAKRSLSQSVEVSSVFSFFDAPYMLNASSLNKKDATENPKMARTFIKQQGSGKQVRQIQGGVTLSVKQRRIGHFQTTLYGVSRSLYNAIPGRIIGLDRFAGGVRSTLSRDFSIAGVKSRVLLGSDIERQQDARVESENKGIAGHYDNYEPEDILNSVLAGEKLLQQDESVVNTSIFAELVVQPKPSWRMVGGVRLDRYKFDVMDQLKIDGVSMSGERRMHNTSPMIGVSYHYAPHITVYSHYSTAFQTPTTTELSNQPNAMGGFNPHLGPEKIGNLEFGVKCLLPSTRLQFDLALYRMLITDMLIPYQIESLLSEEIYFRNAGQARNHGIEIVMQWYPAPWFTSRWAYTFSDFQFTDYRVRENGAASITQLAGNNVPGIPPHHVNVGCDVRRRGFKVGLNLHASDAYVTNDFNGPHETDVSPNAFINDAFVVLDVDLEYSLNFLEHEFAVYGIVENLLNKRHNRSIIPNAFGDRFFEPAAGRRFFIGVKLNARIL